MENVVNGHLGKIIAHVELSDQVLTFRFADGQELTLTDTYQFCCETRYMHTDDDLSGVVGGRLYGIEVRDAPSVQECEHVYEVQFLVVKTSKGEFVVCTHNDHNGYYGGFNIVAR